MGSPITITATANNNSNVTFWVDNDEGIWKWIGNATAPPYQVTNYIVKPGTKKIRARVVHGGTTTNAAIDVNTNNNGGGTSGGTDFNCPHSANAFPGSFTIGIDGAQPIMANGGNAMSITTQVENKNRYELINESGAKFVRLNFLRPNNSTQSDDYNWLDVYDNIVCEFARRNIPIYGLVTDVVADDGGMDNYPTYGASQSQDNWIDNYVDAFDVIVKRYQGYITVYESFNEPNVWVADETPKMTPNKFASLLQKTYNRVRPNGSNPYNVRLITGPLEAHDGYSKDPPQNSGSFSGAGNYFQDVLGNLNGHPFDGIGYHVYARKNGGGQWDLELTIHNVLESIWTVTNDVPWNKRQLYISEVGWNAEAMSKRIQGNINDKIEAHANFITRGLKKLKQNNWRIKAVSFFSIESFNTDEEADLIEDFGLVRPYNLKEKEITLPAGKKDKCWCVYQKMVRDGKDAATARSQCGVDNY